MATLSIHVEVEDVAVGPVLILLRKTRGVIKFHVDLEAFAPPQQSAARPLGVNNQEIVVALLAKHHGGPVSLKEMSEATGIKKTSLHSALNQLRQKNMVTSKERGIWKFTERARRELLDGEPHVAAKPVVHALPAPTPVPHTKSGRAARGHGWKVLHGVLTEGPRKREELTKLLEAQGVSGNSITGILERARRDKLATNDGKGTWQLTAKGKQPVAETTGA
jgi:DNA-binding transcriptional ArsR family regulator